MNQPLNELYFETDIFNNTNTLKWKRVDGNNTGECNLNGFILTETDNRERLFFTINNINGQDYIILNFPRKDFMLKKGDKFQILLNNNILLTFDFTQNPYIHYKTDYHKLNTIYEIKCHIKRSDLELLSQHKIINWKLNTTEGQQIQGLHTFGVNQEYNNLYKIQNAILTMTQEFINRVDKLEKYHPIYEYDIKEELSTVEVCYVYLMKDLANNYHKIGISNKPHYREKTLQSDKPTIELIASKKFPSRQIASSIEKALHNTFNNKNIRGEWFDLTQKDIEEIIETLK